MSAHYAIYIVHRGKQAGPFSLAQMRQQIASGNIPRDAMAWFQGATAWTPLNQLFPDGLEIEDRPPKWSNSGLSLVRDPTLPPPLPSDGKWAGPSFGGGKLFIPGADGEKPFETPGDEEPLSTPAWEKREAERLRKKEGGSGVGSRLFIIVLLLAAIYWVIKQG